MEFIYTHLPIDSTKDNIYKLSFCDTDIKILENFVLKVMDLCFKKKSQTVGSKMI